MPESQGEARIAFAVTLLDGDALEWWRQFQNSSSSDADVAGSDATTTPVKPLMIQIETPFGAEIRAKMAVTLMKPSSGLVVVLQCHDCAVGLGERVGRRT